MSDIVAYAVDDITALRMIRLLGPVEPGGPFGFIAPSGKRYGGFRTRDGAQMEARLAGHGDVDVRPCSELLSEQERGGNVQCESSQANRN